MYVCWIEQSLTKVAAFLLTEPASCCTLNFMSDQYSDQAYVKAADHLIKNSFTAFVQKVFYTLDPTTTLSWNWHLDYQAWLISRTLPKNLNPTPNDPLRRLILNVPPRSLKSIMVSVALPAFLLGHEPSTRIIGASYSNLLSTKFSEDCGMIMRSPWYQRLFPETIIEKDTQIKLTTSKRGHRIATSTGGTVTGEGGDYLIADDLVNPKSAESETERETANEWFDRSLSTRLNDKHNGVIIVIMQRLHELDLTGHLLTKNQSLAPESRWFHGNIPAVMDRDVTYHYGNQTIDLQKGDLLHPDRMSATFLEAEKVSLGSYSFAAQYLQHPAPEGGGIVKMEWFKRYHTPPNYKDEAFQIIQSWDTAIKVGLSNDYTVCTTWFQTSSQRYLIDVSMGKWEFPALKAHLLNMAEQYGPNAILIEDKASGQQLIQEMRLLTTLPIIAINPGVRKKVERLIGVSAMIEAGTVSIPQAASWLPEFEQQLLLFPNGAHDDIPDSVSQFLEWSRKTWAQQYRIRVL